MFPAYPGFENLPLRVEVQWRGAVRPVVARLEQWPDSGKAVLVCAFEDDETNGPLVIVVTRGGIPYSLKRPEKLLHHAIAFEIARRQMIRVPYSFKPAKLEKMKDILRRAFTGIDFTIARPLQLDTIPTKPKLALCLPNVSAWITGDEHQEWSLFRRECSFEQSHLEARQQLLQEWQTKGSNVKFAWEWAALNKKQKLRLIGWKGKEELSRITTLILKANIRLWESGKGCSWNFSLDKKSGELKGELYMWPTKLIEPKDFLTVWDAILTKHCFPDWRADWFRQHLCVAHFALNNCRQASYAQVDSPPTAHEQLEAKIQLRDWLEDKATPAEIEQLLAN